MPMVPSPFAAATYAAVKVAGYSAFAWGLNRVSERRSAPLAFGAAKTALGLLGGIVYLFILAPRLGLEASVPLYLGAIPVRLLVWGFALALFYGLQAEPRRWAATALLGTAVSYGLDGVMFLLDRVLPGMSTPWC